MVILRIKLMVLDLKIPELSYFFGFIQADSSFSKQSRDRGKLSIEISYQDVKILKAFGQLIPYNSSLSQRTRDTNYKDDYKSCRLTFCQKEFRDQLVELGLNYGRKSKTVKLPKKPYVERDYFRGLIDGDGSLGTTVDNVPFFSLTTSSEDIKEGYLNYIFSITGKRKNLNRNSRDSVYNICMYSEDAQKLTENMYYNDCLCLDRKRASSEEVLNWKRPAGKRRIPNKKFWDEKQDLYIMSHTLEESVKHLDRSKSSIKTRKWRLLQQ